MAGKFWAIGVFGLPVTIRGCQIHKVGYSPYNGIIVSMGKGWKLKTVEEFKSSPGNIRRRIFS